MVFAPGTGTGCHRVLAGRGLCLSLQQTPPGRAAHRACSLTWRDGTHRKTAAAARTCRAHSIARPLVSPTEWAVASIMARADLSHARMVYPTRARIKGR